MFVRQKVKKILKKILTTCGALVLSIVLLSGCSWAKIDSGRYYKQLVATVGDMEFTKKDLIDAFNNYGYQYYQQNGYDMESAVEDTITSMIDRQLLLEEVKKNIVLTPEEKLEIRKSAFDYIQDTIYDYEEQVREEWDMEIKTETTAEGDSLRTAEEEYTPSTRYDEATGTVIYIDDEEDEEIFVGDITEDTHFDKSMMVVTDARVSNEAWTRYVKALQDAAKNEGRDSDEKTVLLAEEERLIKLISDNKYLEKFKEEFYKDRVVDVTPVLQYYRDNYLSQVSAFTADPTLYDTKMQNASTEYVYYHPNGGTETSYVNCKHILIKFSDAQSKRIEILKAQYGIGDDDEVNAKNPNYNEYLKRLEEIAKDTKSTFELDGEIKTWSAQAVYDYVKRNVTGSAKERSIKFNELIYVFNDDDGMMNSEFDYVVNLDTNVTDQMVKSFADGVRALDESNGGQGAGSMDMILSEYGYHIIFHDGVVDNLVDKNNIRNISDEKLLEILCTHTTSPDSNKTIFNYLYDKMGLSSSEDEYNNMTTELIADLRNNLKANDIVIKLYVKNYKDLYED